MIKKILFISLLSFMTQLDGAMLLTALPRISADLGVSVVELGFAMTAFYLMHAIALPACGWLVDKIGSKNTCVLALISFSLVSLVTSFADSYVVFTLCRFLQGANAALMIIGGRNALLELSSPDNRLQVMTIASMPMLLAPTLGPPLGGLIVTYGHWSTIYFVSAGVSLLAAMILYSVIPKSAHRQPREFDVSGFVLISISIIAFLVAFNSLGLNLFSDMAQAFTTLSLLVLAVTTFYSTLHLSKRKNKPILDFSIFSIPTFRISTVGGGMWIRIAYRGVSFVLIILLQVALGYSPIESSLMVLMLDAGDLLSKPWVTRTIKHFSYRKSLVLTAALAGLSMALMSFINANTSVAMIVALFFIAGAFRGMLLSGTTGLSYENIDKPDFSQASVAASVVVQVGNAASISLVSLVLAMSAELLGAPVEQTGLKECQIALYILSAMSFLTAFSFLSIPKKVRS